MTRRLPAVSHLPGARGTGRRAHGGNPCTCLRVPVPRHALAMREQPPRNRWRSRGSGSLVAGGERLTCPRGQGAHRGGRESGGEGRVPWRGWRSGGSHVRASEQQAEVRGVDRGGSTRTITSSGTGSGTGTSSRDISTVPCAVTSVRSSRPVPGLLVVITVPFAELDSEAPEQALRASALPRPAAGPPGTPGGRGHTAGDITVDLHPVSRCLHRLRPQAGRAARG